jgi:flagellar biosynthesis protein FlhF
MRVKLYQALAMPDAMEQVRRDLGKDALILTTRRTPGGVEVTAAVEAESEPASPAIEPHRLAALEYHRLPPAIARKLEAGPLPFALCAAFRFGHVRLAAGSQPLLIVGPPGSGKTLTVARLAARLVVRGVRPLVITADDRRAGAVEQLATFTRVLGLRLVATSDPVALKRAIADRQDDAPVLIDAPGLDAFAAVLIDAPGLDAFAAKDRDELRVLSEISKAAVALALPAGTDACEAADLAGAYAAANATLLVATRLDLARRLGGVLAAAAAGLGLAEAGIGPGVADGLVPMTPSFLAERLLRIPPTAERRS